MSNSPASFSDSTLSQGIHLELIHLFSGLTPQELSRVAQAAYVQKIDNDAFLFFEQDPAEGVYVLVKGKIRLTQVTPDGQQIILRYITPVEEFGVVSVLSEMSYPVSAQAVEDSASLVWKKEAMKKLMEEIPRIALNAIDILAGRIQEFQDRIREMATERVERRIARTLLRLVRQTGRKTPEGVLIDLPLSRQDLAEMNGTTLYTVSRTLSQWEQSGLIRAGREQIIILRPHGLVSIAEDLPSQPGRGEEAASNA